VALCYDPFYADCHDHAGSCRLVGIDSRDRGRKGLGVVRRDNDLLMTTPWQPPNPVRWGAVLAGAVIAAGVMTLLTFLLLALAYTARVPLVASHLGAWLAGAAGAAMLLAGLLAGAFAGVRGPGAGFLNGLTVWALLVIVALAVGAPLLRLFNLAQVGPLVRDNHIVRQSLWSAFVALLLSWAAATIGGAIGGAVPRDDGYELLEEEPAPTPLPPPTRPNLTDELNGGSLGARDPLGANPYQGYGGSASR
jgi:hypothetical protein